ncbi:unnamed protein product [Orchesella dallaii]|uniref:Uncharacterized protein n=1 Tax=Orchesella dallaii TaxID=48710 RepID=A0ABP1QYD0_9HEXA
MSGNSVAHKRQSRPASELSARLCGCITTTIVAATTTYITTIIGALAIVTGGTTTKLILVQTCRFYWDKFDACTVEESQFTYRPIRLRVSGQLERVVWEVVVSARVDVSMYFSSSIRATTATCTTNNTTATITSRPRTTGLKKNKKYRGSAGVSGRKTRSFAANEPVNESNI